MSTRIATLLLAALICLSPVTGLPAHAGDPADAAIAPVPEGQS